MASDQMVTARIILQAQLELQRRGTRRVYALLEHTEPDLAETVLEGTTALYHQVIKTGATPKEARRIHHAAERLVLVSILALQKAHQALWQESTGQDLSIRLNPPPGAAPDADTATPHGSDHDDRLPEP